jgi:hypothetical protein
MFHAPDLIGYFKVILSRRYGAEAAVLVDGMFCAVTTLA